MMIVDQRTYKIIKKKKIKSIYLAFINSQTSKKKIG